MTYLYQDGMAYPIIVQEHCLSGQRPREFAPYHYACTTLKEKVTLAHLGIDARLIEQKEGEH
ncbi:MAG: hypothetical protein ACI4O5_01405 [Oscillospiraceae bacterium]